MSKKRFIAVVSYYVYADTQEQAIEDAQRRCDEQRRKEDDRCTLDEFYEMPYAALKPIKIKIK